MKLSEAFAKRHSHSGTIAQSPISLARLSDILGHSMKIRPDGKRPHPSGGALYPMECYVTAFAVDDLARAHHHYRPETHSLEQLWDLSTDDSLVTLMRTAPECKNASALIILTAVWERSSMKYNNLAFEHALIEAGHIGQNILLAATALDLGARPFAAYAADKIETVLDLDPEQEQPVYVIAIGNKE